MFRNAILIIMVLHLISCESGVNNEEKEYFNPSVTGIHSTSAFRPYGTRDTLGQPSYHLDDNFVTVSNPFICEVDTTDPLSLARMNKRITFIIDKDFKQIEIYKINYSSNPNDGFTDSKDLKRLQEEFVPVHELYGLDKDHRNSLNWFIFDYEKAFFQSGFYRALVVNNDEEIIYWFDLYIVQPHDEATWEDPTGWL
jgi:hypothetical protein